VIVSSLMLHHAGGIADRQRVLREIARVLKPGGALLLYDARPLISAATGILRASGLTAIERSGRLMVLLSARRPDATVAS
jgi:ubiquinone/menaquinone biosynthesis C-methylase UbiE